MKNWQLNDSDLDMVLLALREDLSNTYCDATTSLLFEGEKTPYSVKIVSKAVEPIVVSGLKVVSAILSELASDFKLNIMVADGESLLPGQTLLEISADAHAILMAERTILNFLRHLCAVSTQTASCVKAAGKMKILDTRKTMPGLRHLEKYAVYCGGGVNHRLGLYDAIMVKDNHVDLCGGMQNALSRLPLKPGLPVIVEIRSLEELAIAKKFSDRIDRVLLDNMSNDLLRHCVTACEGFFDTEASGNITLDRIPGIAKTGVQYASVGGITHSAGNVDLSMRVL